MSNRSSAFAQKTNLGNVDPPGIYNRRETGYSSKEPINFNPDKTFVFRFPAREIDELKHKFRELKCMPISRKIAWRDGKNWVYFQFHNQHKTLIYLNFDEQ